MKTIGITGGVGAGKTEIINYISSKYNSKIIIADKLAYKLECPGYECYDPIVALLGKDIVGEDGYIIKQEMAAKIFADESKLEAVNNIIHPAVKKYILQDIEFEKQNGKYDYYFVEAALLIEEGYQNILDELWYIRVNDEVRRERLKASRGYSDEKIDQILKSQLSDEEFLANCQVVIDNKGDLEDTHLQIDEAIASN